MRAAVPMAAAQEKEQRKAGEQQIGQNAEQMRPVFREKEERADGERRNPCPVHAAGMKKMPIRHESVAPYI